jgi:hypothetical protein
MTPMRVAANTPELFGRISYAVAATTTAVTPVGGPGFGSGTLTPLLSIDIALVPLLLLV